MSKFKRKGRTLGDTITALLESKRLDIAVEFYTRGDNTFLKALFTELGMECLSVAKHTIIREAMRMNGLDRFELRPYLSSINDFTTFNIHWNMLPTEQQYYAGIIQGNLTDKQKTELFEKIKKKLGMGDSN